MGALTDGVKKCFLWTLILTAVIFCVVVFKLSPIRHEPLAIDVSKDPYKNGTTSPVFRTTNSVNFNITEGVLPLCPKIPPNISVPLQIDFRNITLDELQEKYPSSSPWGRFQPVGCRSRVRLAVVIPYRDREEHLCLLLNNLIPFLNKQQADFNIYITEQSPGDTFNRGLLINAGVREALKADNYTCIVIHDVDLIPETSDNYYRCQENPLHLSTANGKYGYKLPYPSYSGGIMAITPQVFKRMNGFSNWYFGWGGEDDDFHIRVKSLGMKLGRNPAKQGRYYAIKHERDKLNPENPQKGKLFRTSVRRMRTEGLSTLHCNQIVTANKTYTWMYVTIDKQFYNKSIKIGFYKVVSGFFLS